MTLVLDAGALIAFDRGDPVIAEWVEAARRSRTKVISSSGCVSQAWRGGGAKQALLARLLSGVDEHPLDSAVSRSVGKLCAQTRKPDVVDAHVALLVHDGDVLVTSDPEDLKCLLRALGVRANTVTC